MKKVMMIKYNLRTIMNQKKAKTIITQLEGEIKERKELSNINLIMHIGIQIKRRILHMAINMNLPRLLIRMIILVV